MVEAECGEIRSWPSAMKVVTRTKKKKVTSVHGGRLPS